MNRETEAAIEELKQEAGNNDVLLRKSIKVIKRADTKGINKDQVIEFLQEQGLTEDNITAAFEAYRSSTVLGTNYKHTFRHFLNPII